MKNLDGSSLAPREARIRNKTWYVQKKGKTGTTIYRYDDDYVAGTSTFIRVFLSVSLSLSFGLILFVGLERIINNPFNQAHPRRIGRSRWKRSPDDPKNGLIYGKFGRLVRHSSTNV